MHLSKWRSGLSINFQILYVFLKIGNQRTPNHFKLTNFLAVPDIEPQIKKNPKEEHNMSASKTEEKTPTEKKESLTKEKVIVLRKEFVLAEYNRHLLCQRYVTPQEFYDSFQNELIKIELPESKIPFNIELKDVKWFGPFDEIRKRLKIGMNAHFYENIIMLVGLDYMGAYANIQLHALELREIEPPLKKPVLEPGGCGCRPEFLGPSRREREYQQALEEYNREIERRRSEKEFREWLESIRAFKDDDLNLFCTIVQQTTIRVLNELFKESELKRERIGGRDVFALLH